MSFTPEHNSTPSKVEKLTRSAREAAETGDRWLISLAHDLGGLGTWARSEVNIVVEAFGAAVHTTLEVTKRVTKRVTNTPTSDRPASTGTSSLVATSTFDVETSVIPGSLLSGDPSAEGTGNLDLLPATNDPAQHVVSEASASPTSPPTEYSPGVLPVVDALERVVSEHAGTGHRTLERDSRFWRLIQLLHLLKPPHVEADGSQRCQESFSAGVVDKEKTRCTHSG